MSDDKNGNSSAPWWRTPLITFSMILAAMWAGCTGIRGDLEKHADRIRGLEIEMHGVGKQLDRIGDRLDTLPRKKGGVWDE